MPRSGMPATADRSKVGQRRTCACCTGCASPPTGCSWCASAIVGGSGFVVNIAVYALCVHALGIDYQVSSVLAWLVAVLNNFVLNRHWTFDAAAGSARLQAMRFFLVSLVAEGFSLGLLTSSWRARGWRRWRPRRWRWRR